MIDLEFMDEALREAEISYNKKEVPVGCVIVVGNQIIARAHNQREESRSAISHAEILAIDKACKKLGRWILDDATIYITLEPCLMCAGAIFQARFKRVVFGLNEPKFGGLGSLINLNDLPRINHKLEIKSGVREEEIKSLMKGFFIALRKEKSVKNEV